MIKVLLMMYRKLMSDAVANSLGENPEFKLFLEQNYQNAECAAMSYLPDIAVVEVPESKSHQIHDYLAICTAIRRASPRCKLMLMCPENSIESKQAAVEAMKSGVIDDFIYYNVSMDYLVSKLEVLGAGKDSPKNGP